MSKIKVNEIEKASGSGITIPTGSTFTITDGLAVSSLPTVTVAKGGTNLTSFTAGDILYATGSTTLAKLPKGTASQTLKMNSGASAPEWATVAAATSNLVKLATITISSGTANVNFDNSLITSTYNHYKILFQGLDKDGDNFDPCMEFSTDNGSSFISFKSAHTHFQLNGSGHGQVGNFDVHRLGSDGEGDAAGAAGGYAEITIPANQDYNDVHVASFFSMRNQNGDHYGYPAVGVSTSNLSARVNYFRIKDHAGGNLQGGKLTLYAFVA